MYTWPHIKQHAHKHLVPAYFIYVYVATYKTTYTHKHTHKHLVLTSSICYNGHVPRVGYNHICEMHVANTIILAGKSPYIQCIHYIYGSGQAYIYHVQSNTQTRGLAAYLKTLSK
jgi:hypothetical protein